jgi:hypothetical protein
MFFLGSKADVLVLEFHVTVCFFPPAIPNIKHQNCIPTATLLTSTKFCYYAAIQMQVLQFRCSTVTAEVFSPTVYSKAVNLPLLYALVQTTLT